MQAACQKPDVAPLDNIIEDDASEGNRNAMRPPLSRSATGDDALVPNSGPALVLSPSIGAAASSAAASPDAQNGGTLGGATFLDPETQQALKRRLQSLGDVVVYSNDK